MAKRLTTTGWLANRAKQKADYLNSPKGLIEETIKGLPEAGEKVGKTIGKAMGIVMKVPFSAVKAVGRAIQGISPKELSPEEIKLRQENLDKIKKASEEYEAKHPGFKVPREMRKWK